MRDAQFVGHVGGVAAAVGVGFALWFGAPAASADDMSAAGTSPAGASRTERVQTRPLHTKRAATPKPASTRKTSTRRSAQRDPTVAAQSRGGAATTGSGAPASRQPLDDTLDGSPASPTTWVVAATARRELGTAGIASLDAAATPRVSVVARVAHSGHQKTSAAFNADGSRAVITTSRTNLFTGTVTTTVTEMDTNTGLRTGSTRTRTVAPASAPAVAVGAVTSQQSGTSPTPDGTRAVLTTGLTDPTTDAKTTEVRVFDTATGDQVGATIALVGEMWPPTVLFGADGHHALVTTNTYDGRSGINTMLVSTIDTATGSRVGTTVAVDGWILAAPTFNADRSHVVYTGAGRDSDTGTDFIQLGVVDTTTGQQVGTTLEFPDPGVHYSPIFSADGSRVLIQSDAGEPPRRWATQVAAVDTTTGTQIGSALTFTGASSGTVLSADGAHALITTLTPHWLTLTSTSRVTLLRIT